MRHFATIVVLDFEYEIKPGNPPNVLCMVAYVLDENLQHVDTIRQWRGEFGPTPPFNIGPDTLVVGYSLWAEMTCFLALHWQLPMWVYDLHTAYLSATNILLPYEPDEDREKERKRLSDACRSYGIAGWENIDKEEMAEAIGEGRWHVYGKAAVLDYCEEDVKNSAELLRRQLRGHERRAPLDPQLITRWSVYSAKSVACVQLRGIPVDMPLWNLTQENKYRVLSALLAQYDPSHGDDEPIYDADGTWSTERFIDWLNRAGIGEWPHLASGTLQLDSDAFRMMAGAHSADEKLHLALEGLQALRDTIGVLVRDRIPIGRDGRNRPSLFPFCTATGRNAHSKSLFNAHASMRSFIKFPSNKIGVYLDWRTQEIGVAAARSGDTVLMEDYLSGDIYHALALMCGLTNDTDIKRWKNECADQRQRMKALLLAILYGMGVRTLARGLGRHPLIASEILIRFRHRYPIFCEWRDNMVQHAMLDRVMLSEFDAWPLWLSTSPNKRSLFNFPMQSGGAEMLRLATNRLCAVDLVPVMLIHDGILLEVDDDDQIRHAIEIMRAAGKEVCDGFEIDVDVDQKLIGGARYHDKRDMAKRMWATVMGVLRKLGALSEAG